MNRDDVVGLYTNNPVEEGLDAVKEALEERYEKNVSTEFIKRLFELVLKNILFQFNNQHFLQLIGGQLWELNVPPNITTFSWPRKLIQKRS